MQTVANLAQQIVLGKVLRDKIGFNINLIGHRKRGVLVAVWAPDIVGNWFVRFSVHVSETAGAKSMAEGRCDA